MSGIEQVGIAAFGLTALAMSLGKNERARRWAPLVGLAGQPFWFWFTAKSGAWGLALLVAAYTGVYVWGAWRQWAPPRERLVGAVVQRGRAYTCVVVESRDGTVRRRELRRPA